jgi:hypothetical protein
VNSALRDRRAGRHTSSAEISFIGESTLPRCTPALAFVSNSRRGEPNGGDVALVDPEQGAGASLP